MQNTKPLDASDVAEREGIGMRVVIDGPLAENLKPSPFIAGLGITQAFRVKSLVRLLNAHLVDGKTDAKHDDKRCYIPFMVMKGPYVKEDVLPVMAVIHDDGGKPFIRLSQIPDGDENRPIREESCCQF